MLLARCDESVGHHEAALGVGVEHLDRLAAADAENVVGADRVPDGMFSAMHSQAVTRTGRLRRAAASVTARTVAAPVMSYFMPTMPVGGFSERPPVSKVMPLPTSARCCARRPAIGDLDEPRRPRRSLADPEDAAEPIRGELMLVPHGDVDGKAFGVRPCGLGERLGVQVERGRVDEILHEGDGLGHGDRSRDQRLAVVARAEHLDGRHRRLTAAFDDER